MSDIEKLRQESKNAGAKISGLETKITSLQQESGRVLLNKGSTSDEFAKIVKELKQADDDLKDARILHTAIMQGIRQAEKNLRKEEMAQTAKRNKEIIAKFQKSPPPCPKCGTNKSVALVTIQPSKENVELGANALVSLTFECQNCEKSMGIRFSKVFDENGRERPPGLQKPI